MPLDSSSWESAKSWREKYYRRSVYLSSKERSLKSEKKYKNHWQAESSYSKRKKNSVKCRAGDSNLGPLVYEVRALPSYPFE